MIKLECGAYTIAEQSEKISLPKSRGSRGQQRKQRQAGAFRQKVRRTKTQQTTPLNFDAPAATPEPSCYRSELSGGQPAQRHNTCPRHQPRRSRIYRLHFTHNHMSTAQTEGRARLADCIDRIRRTLREIDERVAQYAQEIQLRKAYLWDARRDMDHIEKIAVRQTIEQSLDSAELEAMRRHCHTPG